MIRFNYNEIKIITAKHIEFNNGIIINLEECKNGWASDNSIETDETQCIASRNITEKVPYFLFYSKPKVEVIFMVDKGVFRKKKAIQQFLCLQNKLADYGWTTYDLS